jgi:hypothetical protein
VRLFSGKRHLGRSANRSRWRRVTAPHRLTSPPDRGLEQMPASHKARQKVDSHSGKLDVISRHVRHLKVKQAVAPVRITVDARNDPSLRRRRGCSDAVGWRQTRRRFSDWSARGTRWSSFATPRASCNMPRMPRGIRSPRTARTHIRRTTIKQQ